MSETAAEASPREWCIDVCKTCGRVARYPFCEHRGQTTHWFEVVVVREVRGNELASDDDDDSDESDQEVYDRLVKELFSGPAANDGRAVS